MSAIHALVLDEVSTLMYEKACEFAPIGAALGAIAGVAFCYSCKESNYSCTDFFADTIVTSGMMTLTAASFSAAGAIYGIALSIL